MWSDNFGERQPLKREKHLTVKSSSSTQAKDKDEPGTSFSEYIVWQCRLRRTSFIRTFWLVFCTAQDIFCQEYCMNRNCQAVPSLMPYVIPNKSCGLNSLPNISVWMDQVLSLFAYSKHRRRGHDQDNFLSIVKIKLRSWPNHQQYSLNILPATVKIAHVVNEPRTIAPTKPSTEWENHQAKVYSCNSFCNISYLPFSTFASRCRSGNHTRHCGGGSDIRVSKKVFNVTFFCSNKQTNMHKESVIRHIKIIFILPL